jgi:3D (Asp-Asp-Asp) domain-containing protein
MKGITMRLALLAAAVVIGTLGFNTPLLLIHEPAGGVVEPVQASIPPRELTAHPPRAGATSLAAGDVVGRLPAVGAVTSHRAVRATGHVIPADLPQAPLGRFKLTAYSGPQLGQAEPITATGTSARAGRTVAVDPKVIPLGSKIFIEGLGERIAEDVGGGVKGNHIDVYIGTVPQARRFGVQRGTVSLVAPPLGKKRRSSRGETPRG